MSFVSPGKPRARVSDTPSGRVVEIPAKRNAFVLGFLSIWLVGWSVGWLAAASQLFADRAPSGFLLIWLSIWTAGGAAALFAVAWSLAGREVITAAPGCLTIERKLGSFRRARRYDASLIRDLRVAAQHYDPFDFRSGLRFWGISGGWIAFDYGASTIRFAAGVEEAEAKQLAARLLESLPSIGTQPLAVTR